MSDFDVRFRNYENAMHANNNFGLSGQALADQYGRYTVGLQQADTKARNKAQGRAFAKDLARERALARQDYVNFWNRELPKYEALRYAESASRPFSITAGQIENQFGLNRTLMSGADRADYIKFWEQNAPQTQTTTNKPMTWERYAQEHGTVYRKPTNGVGAADKIAEKQIKINNLNKDIKRLQSIVAENPNLQTLIDGKRAEVANLENEVKQIKSGLQTPKVKTPVVEPKVESMGTSYKVGDATPEGFRALVEDAPANTPAPEAHVNTPEALASETQKGNAPVNTPEAQAPEVPKDKVKVKETRAERLRNNPELAERYERFSKVAKKSAKMKGLKKLGKWGAVAALAIGAGALLFKACSSDEKATPVSAEKPEDKVKTKPEETAPVAPVEQPEQPVATENIIQNGDSLEEVANRYGVTVEQLKELNADKVKQFRTADGKIIDGFIVGEDITLPDEVKKVEGLRTKDESIADYEEYLVKNFDKIPQSMWNQVCTPEFRRQHKLGEYKEAA